MMNEFKWNDQLIMEYARQVALTYSKSTQWTGDFAAEEGEMKTFIASKQPKSEWEILASLHPHDEGIHPFDKSCEMYKCGIHSVKRLSDGEVFTVGQWVGSNYNIVSRGTISCFWIKDNEMYVEITHAGATMQIRLKDLRKLWLDKEGDEILRKMGKATCETSKTVRLEFIPAAANGKIPVWLTPEENKKLMDFLHRLGLE